MNSKINSNNYEEYLIDYLDGSLNPKLEAELLSFLEQHPDIESEIEGLNMIRLETENLVYDFKEGLKKSIRETGEITIDNFENFAIAFYEDDLSPREQEQLQNFIKDHPALEADFQMISALKLSTDDVAFQMKEQLHQFASTTNEPITKENYQDFLIAFYEDDLSINRRKELEAFIDRKTDYQQESQIFSQLKLQADLNQVFVNKSQLKRRAIVFGQNAKWGSSIAASIILLFAFYFILSPTNKTYNVNSTKRIAWQQNMIIPSIHHSKQTQDNTAIEMLVIENTEIITKQQRNHIVVNRVESIANINRPKMELNIQTPAYPMHAIQLRSHVIDNSEALAVTEKEIHLTGFAAKIVSRMTQFLGKGNHIQKDRLKSQARNLAEFALAGYNAMTESNRKLNQHPTDQIQP
jgi:hypothetical protein